MGARRIAVLLTAGLLTGCAAPVPDSGATVTLEPLSPQARSDRDTALREGSRGTEQVGLEPMSATGAASASQPGNAGGVLVDDTTYTGGPARAVAATPPPGSYDIVKPEPLPQRPSNTGPSVVGFALSTSHPVGQPVYARSSPSAERAARACDRYASDDLAQAAFLNSGGPETDRQGVDPDGDGYACAWDPERFRTAVR